MDINLIDETIPLPDEGARAAARARWNSVAKPIGSLGVLETLVEQVAAVQGTPDVDVSRRCVAVLCADNGVVAQGVTQSPQDVTSAVAEQLLRGTSSVCTMAAVAKADVLPFDMGMARAVAGVPRVNDVPGTADMTRGPAMGRDRAAACVEAGVRIAAQLAGMGYRAVATGEMGIGNTSTSSAVACALLGMDPAAAVGRGAGLSDAGLSRKVGAVRRALEVNRPDPHDPLDVLAKVGGFDIAGLAGLFIGAALHRTPAVVDGFISSVAALLAVRLAPRCRGYLLASHSSAEPAARAVMAELGLSPVIDAGMRLGEGTGAVCLFPLLDMALALYGRGMSFDDYGMEAYEVNPR